MSSIEMERKYLIKKLPFSLDEFEYHDIKQRYFRDEKNFRVRQKGDKYFLTRKGNGTDTREEHEIEICKEVYEFLDNNSSRNAIYKRRYYIPLDNGLVAELDVFKDKHNGLIIVEVEFKSKEEMNSFIPPSWFGEEVTYNPGYTNRYLSNKESRSARGKGFKKYLKRTEYRFS